MPAKDAGFAAIFFVDRSDSLTCLGNLPYGAYV